LQLGSKGVYCKYSSLKFNCVPLA